MRLSFILMLCMFSSFLMAQPEQWNSEVGIVGFEMTPEFPGDSSQVEFFLNMIKKEMGTMKKSYRPGQMAAYTEKEYGSLASRIVISHKDSLEIKLEPYRGLFVYENKT